MANTYGFVFNPFTGNFDEVLETIDSGSVTGGSPNAFAGFDSSGDLTSIAAWTFDAINQATINILGPQPTDSINQITLDAGVGSPLSNGYEGIIVGPNFSSTMTYLSLFNAEGQFNSGYNNSGGTGIFQDQSVLASGASTVGYDSYGSFPTFAGTVSGGYQAFTSGAQITSGSAVNGVNAFNDNTQIASGAVVNGYTSFSAALVLNAAFPSGGINSFTAEPSINSVVTGGVTTFNDFTNMNSGSSANNFQSLQLNPNLNAGSTVQNFIGANASPNLNGSVTGGAVGFEFHPNGTGAIANVTGLQVDLSAVSTGTVQKMGVNVNDGAMSVDSNWDTSVLGQSPGEFNLNDIGGNLTIATGFPMTNSFGFGVNLASEALFNDNMGPDPTGLGLGFNMVGYVGQLGILSGKTADTLNMSLAGAGVPTLAGDGGTITNIAMYKAAGLLNEGGNLTVTNMYGLQISPNLSSYATNTWGVWVGDATADNWFAKDVVIGGVTGKPVGSEALSVTGSSLLSGDLDMDTHQIHNVVDPTAPQDAATKNYVDTTTLANPMTTAGDIIFENATPAPDRLPIGTAGQVLTVSAGLPSWQTPASTPAAFAVTFQSANYTVLTTDNVVVVDTSGGPVTITLPTVVGITGHQFVITKSSADTNAISIVPNGAETIAYQTTQTITAQSAAASLIADGVNNYIAY